MRIAEDTPERLTLSDGALWLAAIFAAAAAILAFASLHFDNPKGFWLVAAFFAAALWFTRSTKLIVDKRRRTCALRRWAPWTVSRRSFTFDQIADVRVETFMTGTHNQVPTFRLVLVTPSGDVPLTASFETGRVQYDSMRNALLAAVRT